MALFAGKSTCIVIVTANYQWFNQWKESKARKRGEVYEQYKAALSQKILDRFRRIFPHLADKASCFVHDIDAVGQVQLPLFLQANALVPVLRQKLTNLSLLLFIYLFIYLFFIRGKPHISKWI